MLSLLLAALAAAPSVAGPSLNDRIPSTYSGALDWSRSWAADWTTGASPSAPTIECEAAAADGEMTCVGATASKQGNPTTGTAAGYPSRYAAVLDGTGDYYDLGDVGDQSTAFTACAVFSVAAITAAEQNIFAKDGVTAGKRSYALSVSATSGTIVYLISDGTNVIQHSAGTAAIAGAMNVWCGSYLFSADNSSTVLQNTNGTAASATNARGPLVNGSAKLFIGARDYSSALLMTGKVTTVSIYTGWAATAADLAALVASQQARLASKPAGALVSVSSGATKAWDASGNVHSLPANSLAPSPTGAGMEIWSAAQHSNALPTSTTAGWAVGAVPADDAGVSTADTVADAAGPDGSATSATLLTAGLRGSTHYAVQGYTGTAVPWVTSVYLKPGTATWAFVQMESGSGAYVNASTCTVGNVANVTAMAAFAPGDVWCRVQMTKTLSAAAKSFAIFIAEGNGDVSFAGTGAETLTFYAPKAEIGTVAGPIVASAGTPVVGAADVASVATTITNPAKWFVGFAFTGNGDRLFEMGTYGAANSAGTFVSGGNLIFDVFDGAGARRRFSYALALTGAHTAILGVVGGAPKVYIDGAEIAGTLTDVGTATFSAMPSTIKIGVTANVYANAPIRKVCQSSSMAGCRKALQ